MNVCMCYVPALPIFRLLLLSDLDINVDFDVNVNVLWIYKNIK